MSSKGEGKVQAASIGDDNADEDYRCVYRLDNVRNESVSYRLRVEPTLKKVKGGENAGRRKLRSGRELWWRKY